MSSFSRQFFALGFLGAVACMTRVETALETSPTTAGSGDGGKVDDHQPTPPHGDGDGDGDVTSRQVDASATTCASLGGTCATPVPGPPPAWRDLGTNASVAGRRGATLTYDSVHQVGVFFGGSNGAPTGAWRDDTWTLDLLAADAVAAWRPVVHPGGVAWPAARRDHSVAFDKARAVTFVFGGLASPGTSPQGLGDSWTFDGSVWSQLRPAHSPAARSSAAMAYDSARQQVVLFGGFAGHSLTELGDTWIWNGTDWSNPLFIAPGPAGRAGAVLAEDPLRHTLVLFGGTGSAGLLGDTWTWNGSSWTKLSPATSPSARAYASIGWDDITGTLRLFGGTGVGGGDGSGGALDDTWSWNGVTWARAFTALAPAPRWAAAMSATVIGPMLFGGLLSDGTFDAHLWQWAGSNPCPSGISSPVSQSSCAGLQVCCVPRRVCTYDSDCNSDRAVSALWGACTDMGTCVCKTGFHNDTSGRCAP